MPIISDSGVGLDIVFVIVDPQTKEVADSATSVEVPSVLVSEITILDSYVGSDVIAHIMDIGPPLSGITPFSGDILISWDSVLLEGTFLFEDNDLRSDDGLQTAVIISLFTDRRARDDDTLPDLTYKNKKGWWGDLASPEVEEDEIGSRLWLLNREKVVPEILRRAEQYAEEALQWLISDDVAASVSVTAERADSYDSTGLYLKVDIRKIDGAEEAMEFAIQWENMYD